jgi:hypothetical protein
VAEVSEELPLGEWQLFGIIPNGSVFHAPGQAG